MTLEFVLIGLQSRMSLVSLVGTDRQRTVQDQYRTEELRRCLLVHSEYERLLEVGYTGHAFHLNFENVSSQKQFTFDYALAICTLPLDQSSYRLQTLIQYQRDKLGHIDLELLAYLERTCVTSQPPQLSHVHALYEIYKMIKLPLKSKLSRRVELQHRLPRFFSLSLC